MKRANKQENEARGIFWGAREEDNENALIPPDDRLQRTADVEPAIIAQIADGAGRETQVHITLTALGFAAVRGRFRSTSAGKWPQKCRYLVPFTPGPKPRTMPAVGEPSE
jgi:hypothetical protein